MHLNNLVVAIQKTNGETLRESQVSTNPSATSRSGLVYLPFDTEYTIFLKNSSSNRAAVTITIDGTNALGTYRLILQPYESHTVERFILDGNLSKGKKFKFVSANDPKVSNPGSMSNGIIEVACQWEKPSKAWAIITTNVFPRFTQFGSGSNWEYNQFYGPKITRSPLTPMPAYYIGDPLPGQEPIVTCCSSRIASAASMNTSVSSAYLNQTFDYASAESQRGATIEGSESNQEFTLGNIGELYEDVTILKFQLMSPTNNEPVTVADTKKKYCHNCGTSLAGNAKYCVKCGTKQVYLT